jgi:hypothetical protein
MTRRASEQAQLRGRIAELLAKDLKPAQIAKRCGCRADLVRVLRRKALKGEVSAHGI